MLLEDEPLGTSWNLRASARLKSVVPRVSLLVFALLSTTMAIRSDGAWLDDDLCHFQMARASWHYPTMLINLWGRPGCTIPYSLVADLGTMPTGFRAARLLTTAMALLTVWLTWKTARKMRAPFAYLVPLILLLMPEFFGVSFTPCTEIPAALYAVAGTYMLASGKHWWAAVFIALLPVTRHELAPFLVPLALWFLWRRDLVAAVLLGWAEAAWAGVSGWLRMEQPIMRYFTAQDSTPYGSGYFFHYFLCWFKMAGAVVVIFCLAGAWAIVRHEIKSGRIQRWRRSSAAGRRARLRLLVVGGTIGLVALETVLYSFNRFASGGYSTFLVPAAPLMALCACYGIWALSRRLTPKKVLGCSLIAVAHLCFYLHPYRLSPHQLLVRDTIARLHRDDPGCHIVGDSPWITYFDEISPGAREQNAQSTWAIGRALPLYYLCNNDAKVESTLKQINAVPGEMVRSVKISEKDKTADLLVFRRLPGGK